jgi:hypothetical protein
MIYLDFEGYMKKEPSLVGYLIDGKFTQFILDEEFLPIAEETDIKFKNYKKFSKEILAMSNKLGRPIVAWSEREADQFEEFEIHFVYLNLLKETKSVIENDTELSRKHKDMKEYWVAQTYNRVGNLNPNRSRYKQKRWKLTTILKLLEYPKLDTGYGSGAVTKRLTAVKSGLNARGSYGLLTTVQKSKWTKLLHHNQVDVEGMVFIKEKLGIS